MNIAVIADSQETLKAIIFKAVEEVYLKYQQEAAPPLPNLITQKRLMEVLDISESTVIDWKKRSIIPYVQLGNRCYYDMEAIMIAGRGHEKYTQKR